MLDLHIVQTTICNGQACRWDFGQGGGGFCYRLLQQHLLRDRRGLMYLLCIEVLSVRSK